MVLTDEQRKEKKKQYYLDNKEKIAEQRKQYHLDNKEKILANHAKYYLDNIEKIKKYRKDNPKINIVSNWKHQGIIDDDWDGLYDYFITQTNCWICDKVYNNDIVADRRCLDHDNTLLNEPNVRYICCNYCNLYIVR